MRSSKQNMVHGVIYTLELLKLPIEPIQVCSTDAIFFLSQKKETYLEIYFRRFVELMFAFPFSILN
jgi:hypothetical protein